MCMLLEALTIRARWMSGVFLVAELHPVLRRMFPDMTHEILHIEYRARQLVTARNIFLFWSGGGESLCWNLLFDMLRYPGNL